MWVKVYDEEMMTDTHKVIKVDIPVDMYRIYVIFTYTSHILH